MWLLLVSCLLLTSCSMTARRAASGGSGISAPVVVVGVGGLTWDAVSPEATPRLWRLLAGDAAAAATAVRQIGPSCPVDGWLSMSTGRQTIGPRPTLRPDDSDDRADGDAAARATPPGPVPAHSDPRCGALPEVRATGAGSAAEAGAYVPEWRQLQELQDSWEFSPQLGHLAEALADHDVCATAVGPGAALTLADPDGIVHRYQESLGPGSFDCPVTVVDAGAVADPARDLAAVDRRVADVLDRAPEKASVLVTGISEQPGGLPELAAAVLSGPAVTTPESESGAPPRFLVTASTRWDGVVRLLDIPSTLMAAVDLADPEDFSGGPIRLAGRRPVDPGETVGALADVTRADQVRGTWADDFRNWLGGVQLVLYGVVLLVLEGGRRLGGDRVLRLVPAWSGRALAALVLGLAALPAAAYLVTLSAWWRAGSPDRALWLGMVAVAAGIAVVTALLPRRRPWWTTGTVSLLTFAVLVGDALVGTPLHRGSLLGPSPAHGGRFFGFGNDTFCVFVVVALLLAGAVAAELLSRGRRQHAVAAVVAIGAVTVLVDVGPTWGADVGGGLALLPGIALLALAVADVEITVPRLAGAALGGVALVGAVAVLDWLRQAQDRSHVGRFVQEILDGDAVEIVSRKAGYARDSVSGGAPVWITMVVLAVSIAAVLRPDRWAPGALRAALAQWPTLRPTLAAILLTVVLGSLVNDYGLRIATISLTMGMPLVALTCIHAPVPRGGTDRDALAADATERAVPDRSI